MISKVAFSGQPDWGPWDYVWYEDQVAKRCDGRPQGRFIPARCGRKEQHSPHDFTGTGVLQIRKDQVVEVDLEDGSALATACRDFIERGVAHVVAP